MTNRNELMNWAHSLGLKRTGRGNLALPALARAVPQDDGTLEVTISTDSVDRHGDIVEPSGADVTAFLRNPVVMWAHDYRNLPIGRATEIRVEGRALKAVVQWAPTDFAREVAELYRRGYLHGWSIGFRPIEWEERKGLRNADCGLRNAGERLTMDDGRLTMGNENLSSMVHRPSSADSDNEGVKDTALCQKATGGITGYRITKWELLEFSAVPIPANPDALSNAVRDGVLTQRSLIKSLKANCGKRINGDDGPWTIDDGQVRSAPLQSIVHGPSSIVKFNSQEIAARVRTQLRSDVEELVAHEFGRRRGM